MMNVKVTDVRLPPELQARLEKTTAFQTKIEEAQKLQETKVLLLENDSKKKLEALKKENALQLQNVTAECTRYMTEWQEMKEAQLGQSKVEETKARAQAESRVAAAKGARDVAKAQGQREAEELVRSATIQANASKVKADEECNTMVVKSEARLLAAKNAAEGMIAKAEAEAGAVQKLAVKRKFELEFRRLEVMREIAASGRKVFTGKAADELMNQLVEASTPVHV